jgi:hypothetical protein
MTTAQMVMIGLGLCWILYLGSVTIALVRRLSAQLAVLTIRVTELGETLEGLDARVRMSLEVDRGKRMH